MAENVTKTYGLTESGEGWRVQGSVDGQEALLQAVRLMLQVERGEFAIFSAEYGLQAKDLIGCGRPYVVAELERRVKECLLQDERILAVEDFAVSESGGRLLAQFVVKSVYGESESSAEVVI